MPGGRGGGGAPAMPASVPSDTEQHAPHALKRLLLDTTTDSARRPCPTSSTCPLRSAVPESRLEQMADDPRAHLLTFPPRVVVYPPGTFAYISIILTRVIAFSFSSVRRR